MQQPCMSRDKHVTACRAVGKPHGNGDGLKAVQYSCNVAGEWDEVEESDRSCASLTSRHHTPLGHLSAREMVRREPHAGISGALPRGEIAVRASPPLYSAKQAVKYARCIYIRYGRSSIPQYRITGSSGDSSACLHFITPIEQGPSVGLLLVLSNCGGSLSVCTPLLQ